MGIFSNIAFLLFWISSFLSSCSIKNNSNNQNNYEKQGIEKSTKSNYLNDTVCKPNSSKSFLLCYKKSPSGLTYIIDYYVQDIKTKKILIKDQLIGELEWYDDNSLIHIPYVGIQSKDEDIVEPEPDETKTNSKNKNIIKIITK